MVWGKRCCANPLGTVSAENAENLNARGRFEVGSYEIWPCRPGTPSPKTNRQRRVWGVAALAELNWGICLWSPCGSPSAGNPEISSARAATPHTRFCLQHRMGGL
jgi:hypothetical protein